MTARTTLVLVALGVLFPSGLAAQSVRLDGERGARAQVYASTGFDRAVFPVTLGAAMRLDRVPRPFVIGLTWTIPTVELDIRDRRTRLYAEVDLFPDHGFMLRLAHGWSVTTTDNDAFEAVGLAADLAVTAGWSAPRFMIGAEVGAGLTLFSSIESTAWARNEAGVPFQHVIRHASAFTARAGLRTAVVLGPIELALRFGWDHVGQYSIAPPMYAQLGIGARFGRSRETVDDEQ